MGKLPFEKIKRKILVKNKATISKLPEIPVEELINYGVININKPAGPTSHQVSEYVQKILNIKKSGHSGTLDPRVTGCLPIALERATRIVQTLLKAGKEYVCVMHVHQKIPQSKIHKAFKKFIGKIEQIPPIRSAVKRQKRTREIYYLDILEIKDQEVLFKVGCEAGTYIRKLAHDIGKELGTGAHMAQLIRTKAGPFTEKDMFTLHDLIDAYQFYKEGNDKELKKIILPIEKAIEHLPKIWVLDTTVNPLCHGADLYVAGISQLESEIKENDVVAVLTHKNELICIGEAKLNSKEILKKDKGTAVKTTKVFMKPETYNNL